MIEQVNRLPVDPESVIGPKDGYFFARGRDDLEGKILVYFMGAPGKLEIAWKMAQFWSAIKDGSCVVGVGISERFSKKAHKPIYNHNSLGLWVEPSVIYKGNWDISDAMWEETR